MDNNVFYALLLTLIAGLMTGVGSIMGLFVPKENKKFLSVALGFSAGVMLYVSFIEMFPKAQEYLCESFGVKNGVWWVTGAFFFGMVLIMLIDNFIPSPESDLTAQKTGQHSATLERMGLLMALAIAIHNFPEGLAIGSGFDVSTKLGLGLAIAICLHDVPEGISMAVPLKNGGMSKLKVIYYVILSGVATGVGAFFGAIIGNISTLVISICLSFAAGAMLYIVSGELIPEANNLYRGKMSAIGSMLGIIVGIFGTKI